MQTTTKNDRARVRRNIRALVRFRDVIWGHFRYHCMVTERNDAMIFAARIDEGPEYTPTLREIISAIKEGEPV